MTRITREILRGRRLMMVAHANSAHTGRWAHYFQEQGMIVQVVTPVDEPVAGVKTTFFPGKRRWYHRLKGLHVRIDYHRWKKIFAEFAPDITHVHYPDGGGRNHFYFDHIRPLITSTWGSEVVESPEFPLSEKHKAGVRALLARSDVITATTQFLAERTAPFCLPGTHIHIIPFGIEPEEFKPRPRQDDGLVRLGFFKNLERKYGPEVLLEAFAVVAAQRPQARLTLCGKGDMQGYLEKRVAALGLSDRVGFPGRLPHAQMAGAMNECDIFVMPSTCQESFGVAAIEASACEIPVIATRVGGVPEAVLDEKTGILVEPFNATALANACLRLIDDPDLRRRLGVAGRAFVMQRYQWQENAARMGSIYADIIAGAEPETPRMYIANDPGRETVRPGGG